MRVCDVGAFFTFRKAAVRGGLYAALSELRVAGFGGNGKRSSDGRWSLFVVVIVGWFEGNDDDGEYGHYGGSNVCLVWVSW